MTFSFSAGVRDSLSNLAASLGAGRDKASHDAFTVFELGRAPLDAMYRGDWLARKVVDIVPYDSVRAWRSWSGHRSDVARFKAAERRLGLRRTVQRAMTLGRLYGGGVVIIGDREMDIARLAQPPDPPARCRVREARDSRLPTRQILRFRLSIRERRRSSTTHSRTTTRVVTRSATASVPIIDRSFGMRHILERHALWPE